MSAKKKSLDIYGYDCLFCSVYYDDDDKYCFRHYGRIELAFQLLQLPYAVDVVH